MNATDKEKKNDTICDVEYCGIVQKKVLYDKNWHRCTEYHPWDKKCVSRGDVCPVDGHCGGRDD